MRIERRYKDNNGKTIGYDVSENNKFKYIENIVAIHMAEFIDNAVLMKNKEFRAKKGYNIDTIIVHNTELSVRKLDSNFKSELNIDYYGKDYINICRRLRRYAEQNKIEVSMNKHKANGGRNTHLFKMIKACDIDVDKFITQYIYNIQPYSLSRFQGSRNISKDNIWISDTGYGVELVIKVNESNKDKPVIVSFHESNIEANFNIGAKEFNNKPCAVIIEKAEQRPNCIGVDYVVQRGFIAYKIHSITQYCNKDVALVKYIDIQNMFSDTIASIIEKLQETYEVSNDGSIPLSVERVAINKISFMSFGFATVNNISLLIDMFSQLTDKNSRKAISEIAISMLAEVSSDRLKTIQTALIEKYENSKNGLYLAII